MSRGYPKDGITTAGQGVRCFVAQLRSCGVKEREAGSEFEGIGWSAHQALDGNTGLQLLRHSRGDFFVAGAQNRIAEIFARFVEVPDAEKLRGSRTAKSSELGKDIPNPMAAFSAGTHLRQRD